jgi:BASS family bile acid:Na+ symporter
MLLPLEAGLLVRARYEEAASELQPVFAQASNIGLIFLVVLGVVLNFESMLGLIGSLRILAAALFVLGMLTVGYGLGGPDRQMRSVLGLGAGQRNISAALVVAGGNFGTEVVTYLLIVGLITMAILMPAAGGIGRRAHSE